jgi:hypothetical protein
MANLIFWAFRRATQTQSPTRAQQSTSGTGDLQITWNTGTSLSEKICLKAVLQNPSRYCNLEERYQQDAGVAK